MNAMRSNYALKNIKYTVINTIIVNISKFLLRMAFIHNLSIEYLGINGVLSNMIALLSITEMGIGTAIVYSLYKPLAINDIVTVKTLMYFFKKVYRYIGIGIFIIGISLIPFFDFFIKDNNVNFEVFYLIFLIDDVIGYFYSYKPSLLNADQRQYIVTNYHSIFQCLLIFGQIIVLFFTKSYLYFLIIMLLIKFLEYWWLSKKTEEIYPFLKENVHCCIDKDVKKEIINNTKALVLNKVANIVNTSTFNLLISKFIGLKAVGLYSNYYMIINAINIFASQLFNSIAPSVGNLIAIDTKDNKIKVFKVILFCTAIQASVLFVCLFNNIDFFIKLWLGEEFVLNYDIVLISLFLFYITYIQNAVRVFKESAGLYWQERYRPLLEIIINIILSIILIKQYDIIGILFANIISKIFTSFWIEPYILFKNELDIKMFEYMRKILEFSLVTMIVTLLTKIICSLINGTTIVKFLLSILLCLVTTIIVWSLIYKNSIEFKYLMTVLKEKCKLL